MQTYNIINLGLENLFSLN